MWASPVLGPVRLTWLLVAAVLLAGCATSTQEQPDAENRTEGDAMTLKSTAFDDGGRIPVEHTCDGEDVSPPLEIGGVPGGAETLALIVDDPDAPREEPWVHWLIWNLPADASRIPQGYPPSGDGQAFDPGREGTNDFGNVEYGGPCPPPSHDAHTYRFILHAVDTTLDVPEGAERDQLEQALQGHVLAKDTLTGRYERQ